MYPLYDRFNDNIEVDRLHQAIAQLPEKQRRRLVLYYFGEFTYEQIAEMEGCKYQTVQDSIYAALKNLKKFLTNDSGCDKMNKLSLDREQRRTLITKQ